MENIDDLNPEELRRWALEQKHRLEAAEAALLEKDRKLEDEERKRKEEEGKRKDEERKRKEEEGKRKDEERKRKDEERLRKEEERLRKEEERLRKEEERKRKEEERKRKDEERKRKDEERKRKAAEDHSHQQDRRREIAENIALDERRRREIAEKSSRRLTIQEYLESYHSIDASVPIITDPTQTTKGETTNPVGRLYPRRIIQWHNFSEKQEEIWDILSSSLSFSSQPLFPSRQAVEHDMLKIKPLNSEMALHDTQVSTVESVVKHLVDIVHKDPSLRSRLGLQGTVEFESHTNLGSTDTSLSYSLAQIPMGSAASGIENLEQPNQATHQKVRGKGNRADQFCIYSTSSHGKIPLVAIEYKPPHKLTQVQVATGLTSDIEPDRDVINQNGEGFEFASKWLTSAVVTQLFSYMVGKGIQYGYVCTGETFVFLNIRDDPSCVYYSVCIPKLDFEDDYETRLHRTAVAQVFAFVLQATRSTPPSQAWRNAVLNLDVWCVEYDDILKRIPETVRKEKRVSPYKPQRWKGFKRSPIRTRSRCLPVESVTRRSTSDDDTDDHDGDIPSPSADYVSRQKDKPATRQGTGSSKGQSSSSNQQGHSGNRQNVQTRPFCTHKCLQGMALGGPMDQECPNALDHGNKHISQQEFLSLVRDQLAVDLGDNADCIPLYLSGARGSIFKVRLSSHGYTLVAKGVQKVDVALLSHEEDVYDHIRNLQGIFVPVCLGIVDLIEHYYYDGGIFTHFLFMSYAGQPAFKFMEKAKGDAANEIIAAFSALHQYQVLHCDAELRNIVYDVRTRKYMIVDLERARVNPCQPLGTIGPNIQPQKEKQTLAKGRKDPFTQELESLQMSLSRCA
ncbi:hypothetical protein CFIMG_007398RA00001 [Ceratocystis fimbriata CBS 114723]|uniref:Protein kinase domain-containing protein n=1 Tax=Ceratocystis fimbriata CBS 114723 TaxID=1035309 RepID=A0A2C5WQU7_9PEZI|nr:hypothetical protein CFIMG_007398RA00001 [Ceratocystis fimbriata CBS 114723]